MLFRCGIPVADEPFQILQVILVRGRNVGGVPPENHDPFAVSLGVDHGVTCCRVGKPSGRFDPGDAFFQGDIRAQQAYRLDFDRHHRAQVLLEQIGVDLFDCGATLERFARLVRVLGVRRPEGADRFDVGGVECFDEIVGRRPDRLFVGVIFSLGRGDQWYGWLNRPARFRARWLGSDNQALMNNRGKYCPKKQYSPDGESDLLCLHLHWLLRLAIAFVRAM